MNKYYLNAGLTIVLYLISTIAFSQNIKFNYDACGNRIARLIVIKSTEASITDSIVPIATNQDQNLENIQITIYPNPTTNKVQITCTGYENSMKINAYLFSEKGELLKSFMLADLNQVLDLEYYSAGLYYLRFRINDKVESWKIIKQ